MFNSSKLKNGLNILTYNMPYVNSVAINLIVNVGSRFEEPEEEGIAHFLEHMAFKGTKTRNAKQIAEEFDAIGGHFNAYTSHEQTVYYAKTLSENSPKALEILSDIIENSIFSEDEIKKEYQVILQEIAHSQDNPDDLIYEKFYNSAYLDQPLGKSILGSPKILSSFKKENFLKFIEKHYNADNIYLSVAGNISHEEIVSLAEKYFSFFKSKARAPFKAAKYIGGNQIVKKDLEQTTMLLGFESISYMDIRQLYQSQLLSIIFGGGMSSRLFQKIREQLGLVYSIGSYNSCYCDSGVFTIYASTSHDKLQQLTKHLLEEISNITYSITNAELERAKIQIKSSLYMAQEKTSYKSEEIGKNYAIFGKYTPMEEIIDLVMGINSQDIIGMAGKILRGKPTLAIIGPMLDSIDYQQLCLDLNK